MSWNICLSGVGSELVSHFFPPIELCPKKSYVVGLSDLEIANTIFNVTRDCNMFHYYEYIDNKKKPHSVTLPEGSYEVQNIIDYLLETVPKTKIVPNTNTMKVEIESEYEIDFSQPHSIGRLLGFSKRRIKAHEKAVSDIPIEIFPVSVIRLTCNLVTNSYVNGKPSHTLFSFPITVDPGYKLSIAPSQIIYLPINKRSIEEIVLRFEDQNGKLINFRGESTSARLHLKEQQ